MVCFLGRADEETGLLRAVSPTRVQGQLPGRWVGILFLREPVCRFDIIVLPFFSDGASHLVGYTERTTTVLSFFQTEWDTGVDAFLRS